MAHRNKQTVTGAQSQLQPGFTRLSLSISEQTHTHTHTVLHPPFPNACTTTHRAAKLHQYILLVTFAAAKCAPTRASVCLLGLFKAWKAQNVFVWVGVQGSEVPGSGGGYCTHKHTHNVPMARKNGGKWGKVGENGGKWGGNGEKWGEMGKNKETWVVQPGPFPAISFAFPPHFPPFPPIFPHFPPFSPIFPWELSPFSPIFPRELSPLRPPHSLVANLNLDFWPFQPQNFPFFHQAI